MSEKKQIKTTDWLTRGISKEQLEREKREAIMSADLEMCHTEGCYCGEVYTDFDATAEKMVAIGYRKQSENVIELPCKVGDKVYFNYVELNEICPATVIGIYNNYYTPSIPWWVTIEYESQLIGRHEVKIAVDVFNLVCHKTKEEAEAKMKGGADQ